MCPVLYYIHYVKGGLTKPQCDLAFVAESLIYAMAPKSLSWGSACLWLDKLLRKIYFDQ